MTSLIVLLLLLQTLSSSSSSSMPLVVEIDKCTTIISGKWTGPKPLRNPLLSPSSLSSSSSSSVLEASTLSSETENDLIPDEIPGDETLIGPIFPIGEGGPLVTHTADCSDCDFRLAKVPAKDWPAGSKRALYLYKGEYPATISERSSTWSYKNLEGSDEQLAAWGKESTIVGYIPQVSHTYALVEAGYGIMNEHQVAIGESTCAARFWGAPVIAGGKALMEARELTKVALERSKTARETIQVMGDLASTYGFYAADWSGGDASKGEGGEALTVIDKNEAWVFHILADDTGASAIWAAQRVPDGHVAAVANQFIIRKIDTSSDNFMYSANIFDVAKRQNLWSEEDGQLDFLKTFAPMRAHSAYTTRRVWRVFNLLAPSISLPPYTTPYQDDYPFSVPLDSMLTPEDLMRVQRDHYEGTEFDLTKGLAAGPYGDPNRFDPAPQPSDNLTMVDIIEGSYERAISLFRTSYSFVAQSRNISDTLGLLWFGPYAPSSTSYAPIYIHSDILPASYTRGSLFNYDPLVSFWSHLAASNYASRFYKFAFVDVQQLQKNLFDDSLYETRYTEAKANKILSATTVNYPGGSTFSFADSAVKAMVTAVTNKQAAKILLGWTNFLPKLITKYHDGYIAQNLDAPTISMHKLFYPKEWLDATGFWNSKINRGEDVIMFQPTKVTYESDVLAFTIVVSSVIALLVGFFAAKIYYKRQHYYQQIN